MYTAPTPTPGMSGIGGAILAGGAIYIAFVLFVALITLLIWYAVIKTAVRQGMIEAIKKTGLDSAGSSSFIQGYPPVQNYGAPVAPAAQQQTGQRNPYEF